jgi:hypothetical protein
VQGFGGKARRKETIRMNEGMEGWNQNKETGWRVVADR